MLDLPPSIYKADGFDTIMARIIKYSVALKGRIGENGREQKQLEASSVLDCTALLVDLISRAGEALDEYIQTHSEVPPFLLPFKNRPTNFSKKNANKYYLREIHLQDRYLYDTLLISFAWDIG